MTADPMTKDQSLRLLYIEQIRRDTEALREGVICPDEDFYRERIALFRQAVLEMDQGR